MIKLEPPGGDPARETPPPCPATPGLSALFRALNANKRSVVLDLARPEALPVFHRLVERADVLVESFRPGVLERLGAGRAECRRRNPRLVTCAITGYGGGGPDARLPGHDLNFVARAGVLGLGRGPDGSVAHPALQVADVTAGCSATIGILLALLARERTGRGQDVETSMLEGAATHLVLAFAAHLNGDPQRAGRGFLTGLLPGYGVYRTRDGRDVALAALEPKFFASFAAAAGRPEWAARWADPALRREVAALFSTRTLSAWQELLGPAECCFSPVSDLDEAAADPQLRDRGFFVEDGAGGLERLAPPIGLSETPWAFRRGAPAEPGAHTAEVLRGVAGLTDEDVRGLLDAGAAHQA